MDLSAVQRRRAVLPGAAWPWRASLRTLDRVCAVRRSSPMTVRGVEQTEQNSQVLDWPVGGPARVCARCGPNAARCPRSDTRFSRRQRRHRRPTPSTGAGAERRCHWPGPPRLGPPTATREHPSSVAPEDGTARSARHRRGRSRVPADGPEIWTGDEVRAGGMVGKSLAIRLTVVSPDRIRTWRRLSPQPPPRPWSQRPRRSAVRTRTTFHWRHPHFCHHRCARSERLLTITSTTLAASSSSTTTSIRTLGTRSTVYSAPR